MFVNELQPCEKIVEGAIFEYCYRKYYKRILAYCRATQGLSSAEEDAVQDAFLFFWAKGLKRVNLALNPAAYIRIIARNIFYHLRRCRRLDSRYEDRYSGCDPYRARLNFYELISPLSKEEQRIVELCYFYGFNREEAARENKISRRTCFRRLQHARQKLLRAFRQEFAPGGC